MLDGGDEEEAQAESAAAISVAVSDNLEAFTQDNGTVFSPTTNSWAQILDGDGGFAAITPTTTIGYSEKAWGTPGQGPWRTDNLSASTTPRDWQRKITGITLSDRGLSIPPLIMSQTNSQILYFGTHRLYRTTKAATHGTWVGRHANLVDRASCRFIPGPLCT